MHRRRFLGVLGALPVLSSAAWPALGHAEAACCGPITPEGERLLAVLDHSGVDRLWSPGFRVRWDSGEAIEAWSPGSGPHTHCSAFAGSAAKRLGVYLLRPPEHGQTLLANAQMAWLRSGAGLAAGWRAFVPDAGAVAAAQELANRGALVVAVFQHPDPKKAGHIAIVRPGLLDNAVLAQDGPMVTQAGSHNAIAVSLARGFRGHRGAWLPGGAGSVRFFAHEVDWTQLG
jgi:hypothetical protein